MKRESAREEELGVEFDIVSCQIVIDELFKLANMLGSDFLTLQAQIIAQPIRIKK